MQQIGKGARFWWRVLDAPSPQPVASFAVSAPLRNAAPRPRLPVPAEPLTLAVPHADRRKIRKPKRPRLKTVIFSGLTLAAIAVAFAGVAVVLPEHKWRDLKSALDGMSTEALIRTGFGIDQVSLSGQRYTLDSDVFDALDLANVRTFAALDTQAVLHRIERISWVDTAQITRIFPGKLTIEISERQPTAMWTRGDVTYLIDATGRTLGPLPDKTTWDLPRVVGEGANIDTPLLLEALKRNEQIAQQFNYAERIAERRWRVVLTNGSRIELAADREFEGLDTVAANGALRRAVAGPPMVVDVRTPGRATIRPLAAHVSLNDREIPPVSRVEP